MVAAIAGKTKTIPVRRPGGHLNLKTKLVGIDVLNIDYSHWAGGEGRTLTETSGAELSSSNQPRSPGEYFIFGAVAVGHTRPLGAVALQKF